MCRQQIEFYKERDDENKHCYYNVIKIYIKFT